MIMLTYQDLAKEVETKWHIDPTRLLRALEIAQGNNIYNQKCSPGVWDVRSQSNSTAWYRVDTHARSCTCRDSCLGNVCKHRLAVYLYTQMTARPLAEARRRSIPQVMRELGYT
jgi:hypothetical protein